MILVIICMFVIPAVIGYVLVEETHDENLSMGGGLMAIAIGTVVSLFITTTFGQDYEIYLADEKTLCTIDGVKPYGQDGDTYYYILKDENGKYKYSLDSEFVYITENEDTPILKTYERKYNKHWYTDWFTFTPDDGEIDHYELYIPETF